MSRSRFPSTHRLGTSAQSESPVGRASRVASVRPPLATGNNIDALSPDLFEEVLKLIFFRSPTATTIGRLKPVSTKWRDFIEAHTTFKRTNQQPYDVVFGVLVAKEMPYNVHDNPNTMDLIEIKPPNEAKLRFVPDNAFKDPYGLIVSVDFSACDELETIDAEAFTQSPLFRVNLSGCSKLRGIGSSAFGNEDRQITSIIDPLRLHLSGIVPMNPRVPGETFVVRDRESFLSLLGCSALEEIGSNAFYNLKLVRKLDLSDCVALRNIRSSAFAMSRLSQLDLTRCFALKGIGSYAFGESILRNLILSSCTALEWIGPGAFQNSPLTKLDLRVPRRTRPFRVGPMCFKSANVGIRSAGEVLAPALYA